MVDRELEITGVPSEGFDPELEVTGVPSPEPEPAAAPVESVSEPDVGSTRITGGGIRTRRNHPQLRPAGPQDLVGDDRDIARIVLTEYDPSLAGNDQAMNNALRALAAVWGPELRELMLTGPTGVASALAQTEKEYVAARIIATGFGDETTAERLVGGAMRSMLTQYENRAARLHRPGHVFNDQNLVEHEFEKGQTPISDITDLVDPDSLNIDTAGVDGDNPASGLVELLLSDELAEVAARGGVWKVKDDSLAFAFTDDAGTLFAGVHLDEGTVVDTDAQALAALVEAKAGLRHKLVADEATRGRGLPGIVLKAYGDTVRFVERNSKRIVDGTVGLPEVDYAEQEDAGRAEAVRRLESGDAAVEVAIQLRKQPEFAGVPVDDLLVFAAEVTADPAFDADYTAATVDQVVEAARVRDEEEGTWVDWTTETVVPPVVDFLETYDKLVHGIGLTVLAPVKGVVNEIDSDAFSTFDSAMKEARDSDYVSQLYGIDPTSGWGQTINLGASILFDPITWVTPGAKMSWMWLDEMVTNPAMTRKLLTTPQVRSGVRQLVKGDDARVVLSFMADGMSDDAIETLLKVSATTYKGSSAKQAAGRRVYDILARELPSNGGLWTPAAPRTVVHAKNVLGVGTVINDLSASINKFGVDSPKVRKALDRFASTWARASKDRGVSLSDDFLQRALELAVWRHTDDMDKVVEVVESALKAKRSMVSGSADDIAALGHVLDSAKRELRAARRAISVDPDLRVVSKYRQFRDELHGRFVQADAGDGRVVIGDMDSPLVADQALVGDGADVALQRANAFVDAHGSTFDDLNAVVAEKRKEMRRISAELDKLQKPQGRDVLADWVDEFFEGWGDDIGVPRIPDKDGDMVLDWSQVSSRRVPELDEADTSWFVGFTGPTEQAAGMSTAERLATVENAALADNLAAFGLNPERTIRITPASPIEMLGYKHGSKVYRKTMENLPVVSQDGVESTLNAVQNVFAANVLLNPAVAIKSAGDEAIRMFDMAGFAGGQTLPRQAGALPIIERAGTGRRSLSSRAVAYGRDGAGSPSASNRTRGWTIVSPKKDPGVAERFVNGNMVRQEAIQKYARARIAGEQTGWVRWWDETGVHIYQGAGKQGQMSADEAYDLIDTTFKHFTTRGRDAADVSAAKAWDDTVDEVLRAAAEGGQADLSVAQWRQFPDMPGQVRQTGGPIDWAFEELFGRPSDARGAVIFEHFYQWKRNMLIKAANNGSVVDGVRYAPDKVIMDQSGVGEARRLVEAGVASSVDDAADMIVAGRRSPAMQALLGDGWRLESEIDSAAAAYGKAHADSMMYTMGAVSVGGRRLARVFPWGRAQFDYIGWWTKRMFEPTQVKVPFSRNAASVFTPSTAAGGALPELNRVNIRLADRIGKLVTLNPDRESQASAGSPQWMIDQFTFLPSRFDESFIMEQTPSMGPIPSWLVNFLPETNPVRQAVSMLAPSHAIFNDYDNDNPFDATRNLADAIVPASGRTIRRLLTDQIIARGMALFGDTENAIYNTLLAMSEPAMARENLTVLMGDFLENDVLTAEYVNGGPTLDNKLRQIREESVSFAYTRQANENIKKFVGAPSYLGSEAQYAKFYLPMLDHLGRWVADGSVSKGAADSMRQAAAVVAAGLDDQTAIGSFDTLAERKLLANAAADILRYSITEQERNRYILENPGVAMNMVRWVEADEDLVPAKYREFVDNGRIVAPASIQDEMRRVGFDDGWIVGRERSEVQEDAIRVIYRAASDELQALWDETVPFSIRSTADAKLGQVVTFGDAMVERVSALTGQLDIPIPDEWIQPDGSWRLSAGQFKDFVVRSKAAFSTGFEIDQDTERVLNRSEWDTKLLQDGRDNASIFRDMGYEQPVGAVSGPEWDEAWKALVAAEEWKPGSQLPAAAGFGAGSPEGFRELMRERYRDEVALNPNFTEGMYAADFQRIWGPLDYEPPAPPKVTDLDVSFTAPSKDWSVVDGDTIELSASNGEAVPFRLVGINAPERGQESYEESNLALQRLLDAATDVTVGMFRRETFGDTQTFYDSRGNLRERIFGWLYVDGVPVFDPSVFTEANVRGAPEQVGGVLPEYEQWRLRELGGAD